MEQSDIENIEIIDDDDIIYDSETKEVQHIKFTKKRLVEENIVPIWKHDASMDHKTIYVIADEKRRTSQKMSSFELTEVIGVRISQIERGVPPNIDIKNLSDPISIARMELIEGRNPLIIERKMKEEDNIIYVEHWKVKEMTYVGISIESLEYHLLEKRKYDKCYVQLQ